MLQDVNILLLGLIQINKAAPGPVSFLTQLKYHCNALLQVTKLQAKTLTVGIAPDRESVVCHDNKPVKLVFTHITSKSNKQWKHYDEPFPA